jgi:hypothetical protein
MICIIDLMGKRYAYGLLGMALGGLVGSIPWALTGKPSPFVALGVAGASLAIFLAERKGKLKSIEEINRPITLFPRNPS